jgi:hypothetical protein
MSRPSSWTDDQLAEAIKASTHWVGVMRELGFGERASSAGAIRIVRRRAAELGLDSSHFLGKRRWSDAELRQAVSESATWNEVLMKLGLSTHAKKRGHRVAYDPDVIDLFFVIDGDLTMYLIPSRAIAGRVQVLLRTYKKYIVGNAAGLLGASTDAARAVGVVSRSA